MKKESIRTFLEMFNSFQPNLTGVEMERSFYFSLIKYRKAAAVAMSISFGRVTVSHRLATCPLISHSNWWLCEAFMSCLHSVHSCCIHAHAPSSSYKAENESLVMMGRVLSVANLRKELVLVCVDGQKRHSESLCLCVCVCVCVRERERVWCVCGS